MAEWILLLSQKLLSVQLLHPHMREDIHTTRQLRCQWRSGQFHAMRAANAAVTVFMIFNCLNACH